MKTIFILFIAFYSTSIFAEEVSLGNRLVNLPVRISEQLAKHHVADETGAIGRNKKAYFHVRFQLGMHHLASYGIASKQLPPLERFVKAAEYVFRYQTSAGDFKLVLPSGLEGQGQPSVADLASGIAFCMSSLGSGWYAIETNDWVTQSEDCAQLRQRLSALRPKLRLTLNYLLRYQESLRNADKRAPNRLLFNALAFYSLGMLLEDDEAIEVASSFVEAATDQVHPDGYFIENGGFDSSYNGVAVAIGLRLLMAGCREHDLVSVCRRAVFWQVSRIRTSGEVDTRGNTRVNSIGSGESFLGRKKDVDVGHCIEAFILASLWWNDNRYSDLAQQIVTYYK